VKVVARVKSRGAYTAAVDIEAERKELVRRIRLHGKRAGDPWLKKYAGSPLPVLGLRTGVHRQILRDFHRGHGDLAIRDVHRLAASLWERAKYFEERTAAIELLLRYHRRLFDASWRLADSWVDQATGWALSDGLAMGPLARLAFREPARFQEILWWGKSKNPWRRRASVYALRDFVRAGQLEPAFQLLSRLLYDEEFWVQRAVGTWLRECWKKDPPRTEAFLRAHSKGLPRVTITVATERAPKAFREELRRRAGPRGPPGKHSPGAHQD